MAEAGYLILRPFQNDIGARSHSVTVATSRSRGIVDLVGFVAEYKSLKKFLEDMSWEMDAMSNEQVGTTWKQNFFTS